MPNILLVLEYNGATFHGWQEQPGGVRTIQAELKKTLSMLLRGERITIHASGRTDAGVHARAQVVNFHISQETDLRRLQHSISSIFKNEISVLHAQYVEEEFNARFSAVKKQYSYVILNRAAPAVLNHERVWHVARNLNVDLLQSEALALVGEHDFTSLRGSGCASRSPVRNIFSSTWESQGDLLIYTVVGEGFLKHMVRNIVGTLVARARLHKSGGIAKIPAIEDLLQAQDRRMAGPTAPPYGLYLDWVEYPGLGRSSDFWRSAKDL